MLRRDDALQPLTPTLSQRNRGQEAGRQLKVALPTLLVWLIVFVCSVLPLLWLATQIVINRHVLVELRLDSFRLHLLGRTLGYNAAAALVATAMAVPAGIVVGRGRGVVAHALWFVLPI